MPMTALLSDEATTPRRVPLARLGHASDIVSPVAFLASNAASLLTGQILCLGGGWTAQSL